MRLTKSFLVLLLSASVISACSQGDDGSTSDRTGEVQKPVEKVVRKHEAVKLPVTIFKDSNYKIEVQQVTFTRSITNVEIKDFDESSEIEFLERYDNSVRRQGFDLKKDYKLLIISMKHEVEEQARREPIEGYLFNEGTGLVIGDDNLANKNEFLSYQQEYVTEQYRVGTTFNETGNILLAVPNEFANNKDLQLKIVQKLDNKTKYIYIDLN